MEKRERRSEALIYFFFVEENFLRIIFSMYFLGFFGFSCLSSGIAVNARHRIKGGAEDKIMD